MHSRIGLALQRYESRHMQQLWFHVKRLPVDLHASYCPRRALGRRAASGESASTVICNSDQQTSASLLEIIRETGPATPTRGAPCAPVLPLRRP